MKRLLVLLALARTAAALLEGELTARCRIEPGTGLVVDVAGNAALYGGPERLKSQVEAGWSALQSVSVTMDGRTLNPHVIQTPFSHANVPHYTAQVLELPQTTVSFMDYFAILSPISRGLHELRTSWILDYGTGPETYWFWLNVR